MLNITMITGMVIMKSHIKFEFVWETDTAGGTPVGGVFGLGRDMCVLQKKKVMVQCMEALGIYMGGGF